MTTFRIIEEDRGTCTRSPHPHNGYYAGDFTRPPHPRGVVGDLAQHLRPVGDAGAGSGAAA